MVHWLVLKPWGMGTVAPFARKPVITVLPPPPTSRQVPLTHDRMLPVDVRPIDPVEQAPPTDLAGTIRRLPFTLTLVPVIVWPLSVPAAVILVAFTVGAVTVEPNDPVPETDKVPFACRFRTFVMEKLFQLKSADFIRDGKVIPIEVRGRTNRTVFSQEFKIFRRIAHSH